MLSNFRTPDDVNLLFALKCFMLHTSGMVQLKEEIFFRIEKSKRMNFFLIWRVVIRLLICWVAIFLKCNDEALRGEKYARKVPTSVQIHFGSSKRCTILHQNHRITSLFLKGKLFCAGTNIALHISMHFSIFKSISYLLNRVIKEHDCNIFSNMQKTDFRDFRNLIIDMVLHTDMSQHFSQLKAMKTAVQQHNGESR